jgi:hypothetical protein
MRPTPHRLWTIFSLIDEWSNYVSIYLMRKRSKAPNWLKQYKTMAETMHGTKIAFLRTDNAPEYIEGDM